MKGIGGYSIWFNMVTRNHVKSKEQIDTRLQLEGKN